jgi:prepilin-type N-terminal cleavage/methylation domain-containing protein/prepilin-type processing-associated H-X9-DG protein
MRRPILSRHRPSKPARLAAGFTLIELLIVLGVLTLLVGITLPVVGRMRENARMSACARVLSQAHLAFQTYAAENDGYVPRRGEYADAWTPVAQPLWVQQIGQIMLGRRIAQWAELAESGVLRCPSHPLDEVPATYVVNAFAFETAPEFGAGAPAVKLQRIRSPATLLWLLEASDLFGERPPYGLRDAIYYEPYLIVRSPAQLHTRVNDARHGRLGSNLLFLDGHVSTTHDNGAVRLEQFDDGLRTR